MPGELQKDSEGVRATLRGLQRSQVKWEAQPDNDLVDRLNRFIELKCPQNREACFTLEAQEELMESDPGLLSEWISTASEVTSDTVFPGALLSVIESQIPGYYPKNTRQLENLAGRLRELGFRVIRVPKIAGEPELDFPWSGISYTNLLVVDEVLFVPRFGFGPVEEQIFEDLQADLPAPFRVVPVNARRVLLFSGGIHCVTGIIYGEATAEQGNR